MRGDLYILQLLVGNKTERTFSDTREFSVSSHSFVNKMLETVNLVGIFELSVLILVIVYTYQDVVFCVKFL